ncbi:hypothetical protein T02_1026 [Trichinella nativa]|uniref:Uncharacterized protein n=1 Tax=Trichinella nativa TaxID=6335 RepID=A0A0V1KSS2_9BILA|nr:hypothetical protein T02_1026 [Trichinella nativa]
MISPRVTSCSLGRRAGCFSDNVGLQPAASQLRPDRGRVDTKRYARARCRSFPALRSPSGTLVFGRSVPRSVLTPPAQGPSGGPSDDRRGGDTEQLLDVIVLLWIENGIRAVRYHRNQQRRLGGIDPGRVATGDGDLTGTTSSAMRPAVRRAIRALATSDGSSRVLAGPLRDSTRRQGCSSPGNVASWSVPLAVGFLPRGSGRMVSTDWPPTVSTRA